MRRLFILSLFTCLLGLQPGAVFASIACDLQMARLSVETPLSQGLAYRQAKKMVAELKDLPIQERSNKHLAYFEGQAPLLIDLLNKIDIENAPIGAQEKPHMVELRNLLIEKIETALREKKLTMLTMAKLSARALAFSSYFTVAEQIASPTGATSSSVRQFGAAQLSRRLSIRLAVAEGRHHEVFEDIEYLIEMGYLILPTFATLDERFFIGTWPRVRPLGMTAEKTVDYDGLTGDAFDFFMHDVTNHIRLNGTGEPFFTSIENIETRFFKKISSKRPELLSLIRYTYFILTHELELLGAIKDSLATKSLAAFDTADTKALTYNLGRITDLNQRLKQLKNEDKDFPRRFANAPLQDGQLSPEQLLELGNIIYSNLLESVSEVLATP